MVTRIQKSLLRLFPSMLQVALSSNSLSRRIGVDMLEASEVPSYAGFWRRLGAALADAILLGAAGSLLAMALANACPTHFPSFGVRTDFFCSAFECVFVFPLSGICGVIDVSLFGLGIKGVGNHFPDSLWYLPGNLISYCAYDTYTLPFLTVNWLYHAVMESSAKQATFGKILLNIRVTDLAGNRISFGTATARHFSKMLSTLIVCIGYIMVGFTTKRQALHDKLSNCVVVKKPHSA